ncbi:MAG: enoyl-CoA hydratase/isomerase family protein [Gemmatimonadaceae bacterium]|nr:enoyl-CoA hydratase/isomerase family protein [Gemmatimonadaceae bacterium]
MSATPGSAFAHLTTHTDAGVCTITLNRPERLNAVNPGLADELPRAVQQAAADDTVRVVVITGAGRGFCAGLDLAEPVQLGTTRHEVLDPYQWVGRWVQAITQCEKPVIAAINGACAGAGFGLALACDLRVLAAGATCTAGYIRRGLSPDAGVSWFLPRLIGHARAADILFTGRDIKADEAAHIGLVSAVYPDEAFAGAVAAYAQALAAGPPLAFAHTKRLLLASHDAPLDTQLRDELAAIKQCFVSADVREAMAAFREKRAPVFRGS